MSTPTRFPLLKLPLLALAAVVNLMSPDTILRLSFHSKVFKSSLSIVKWKIESFKWRIIGCRIVVVLNSNFGPFRFEIGTQSDFKGMLKEGIRIGTINLNGTTESLLECTEIFESKWLLIPENLKYSNKYIKFKSQLDTLEHLTNFLMTFVKCSKFKLDYLLETNLIPLDFFVLQYVKGSPLDLQTDGIYGNELKMTPDDLKFLPENLKFGKLDLNVCVGGRNFEYQGFVEAKELRNQGDRTLIGLRNLNRQKVILYTAFENSEQIEQIMKNWIQGASMENLEYLQLYKPRNFNPDEFLRDLKHENSRFSRADIRTRIGGIDVFGDIQRESDGRWGTLCEDLYRLYFIVWTPETLKKCCQKTRIKLGLE